MKRDPVTPELREAVLRRDGACFLRRLNPAHGCKDQWGKPHSSYDIWRLSLDHVKDAPRIGKRAASDARHLVAMCHAGNVGVPSREVREAEREYLRSVTA
ncbi:MAG TPA: hypothetical protein VGP44_08115 [Gemmatimonadales bacterium]|nr:hypothetical protein [Gemmatimonadales bacterium]